MEEKDVKEIIKKNPNVDVKLFEESKKQIKILREMGIRGAKYNLVSPFSSRICLSIDKSSEK